MATVVNYLLTLGSHCGLFTAAAEAPPTVRGFNVRATRPLPSDAGWNFICQIFTISSGFIGERVSDTSAGAYLFSVAGRHETQTWAGWHQWRSLHRRRPLARKNLPPTSCCGSDMGCCRMSCVSFHPAVVPKRTRNTTPQRKARNPKATSLPPNAPTIHCFYCRMLICTIFSTAGSSQLAYTHISLRAHTPVSPLPITDLRNWKQKLSAQLFKESGRVRKREREKTGHPLFLLSRIDFGSLHWYALRLFLVPLELRWDFVCKNKSARFVSFVSGIPIHRSHFSQPLCK